LPYLAPRCLPHDRLVIQNLQKSYTAPDGERSTVIDVPTFAMAAGEHVGLRGQSGSGKTTFLNLIAGILQADAGTIRVDGREMTAVAEAGRDRLRAETMGYVFQTFNLLHGYTALENVELGMMFGRGVDAPYARDLLVRVGLGHARLLAAQGRTAAARGGRASARQPPQAGARR
jgi:putative ABC transport system ATP-binding protein